MMFPPLVERELRVRARRADFYWLRGALAFAAVFQGYQLLGHYGLGPTQAAAAAGPVMPTVNGATLLHQVAGLLFAAALLMALATADTLSRERREGTLGLLLLTDVSPAQIVRGKLLSCGLPCFLALLGCLPALMLAVLAGGVTGAEAAMTGLGLLNTLFAALAGGLWMSAVFRKRLHALSATLVLVGTLTFGAEVLGGSVFGPGAMSALRLFGLGGWRTAAQVPVLFNPTFLFWFALVQAAGWFCLHRAATALAKNWQDQPHKLFREPDPAPEWPTPSPEAPADSIPTADTAPESVAASARASWLTDPRPWDADPIGWRVQQVGAGEGLLLLAILVGFLGQFGALSSLFENAGTARVSFGLLSGFGLVLVIFSGALLALAGARFFQHTRRQQDLELLLTTPLGSRNILAGQWTALRRALAWPLGLVLLLALPSGIACACDFANDNSKGFRDSLPPFLILVNYAIEVPALCWVGMCFGLRARNPVTAVVRTVGLVQVLPLILAVALAWGQAGLVAWPIFRMLFRQLPVLVLVLSFFLAKNLALIWWARFRLRRELRLKR